MINFDGAYFKVWELENKGKWYKVKVSSSKKNQDGTYSNSNWFASIVGADAVAMADSLAVGDRIKARGGVSCEKYEDKYPTKVVIFGFDILDSEKKTPEPVRPTKKAVKPTEIPSGFEAIDDDDDSLPFFKK